MNEYKPDIVLYHANCADGFGAAWAAWRRWGPAVQYLPVAYGEAPPDLTGKDVLIGDFSFKSHVLEAIGKVATSVIILDHHKSAREDLATWAIDDVAGDFWAGDDPLKAVSRNDEVIGLPIAALFDMEQSGARLMWNFCHDADAPTIVQLIEDRDLWHFAFEETKPFGLWLRSEPFDFERWDEIAAELDDERQGGRIMAEAAAMQRFHDQKVLEIAALHRLSQIAGQLVPTCNCPPMFASEVCHQLLTDYPEAPFVACYSDQGKARGYSLRSTDDRMDVSQVARSFGGGGHRNAAGFGVPLP